MSLKIGFVAVTVSCLLVLLVLIWQSSSRGMSFTESANSVSGPFAADLISMPLEQLMTIEIQPRI